MQQSWSHSRNVTLLAANANSPSNLVSGSGIYSGRAGALNTYVSGVDGAKILTAQVPYEVSVNNGISRERKRIAVNAKPAANFPKGVSEYNVQFLNFDHSAKQSGKICHGQICCSYDIHATTFDDFYSMVW